MHSRFDLQDKVALVTGASSGLGRHFVQVLASAGASVVLAARRIELLEKIAAQITSSGVRAHAVQLDVTNADSIDEALSDVTAALGHIDILVNNSGVAITKPALDYQTSDWDEVLAVNLRGAFLMSQAVARQMQQHGGGSIINIASIAGLRQAGQVTSYAVSKAGLVQLTKTLALEWARYQIRVNAIAPGYFSTDLNREFLQSEAGQTLMKRIPQRRFGELSDLDGPLLLLASDAGRYMTGSVLVVDGGHLCGSL